MLEQKDEKFRKILYRTAGDWYTKCADYYKAVGYYIKCGSKNSVARSLRLMYNYNSPYASIKDTVDIIGQSVDVSLVEEYPFLLETLAWAAFVEGRGSDMEMYLDRYFHKFPKVVLQNPPSAQTAILLRCMDYRNSMLDVAKSLKKLPLRLFAQANTPSITQNMPFIHRSSRDYSEFVVDEKKSLEMLRKTIGVLLGEEYDTAEAVLRAGLAYERAEFNDAYRHAVAASAQVKPHFSPEIQFCSYTILVAILDAQGHPTDAQRILDDTAAMIERHKAYYLDANYRAFICRRKLVDGDKEAAQDWINNNNGSTHENLTFYKLYQHFTTARAYITTGDYNAAILLIKKILAMCEKYNRPLDIIESNVLLAISYLKKGRDGQGIAVSSLTSALKLAGEYGFSQIFAYEGAELITILHKLQKQVMQKDYNGDIPLARVKSLYIMAMTQSKRHKGLTGGAFRHNLKFTDRQKEVIHHLSEGLTQKEIAVAMGIKPSSVKSHLTLIYNKLEVSSSIDAVMRINELHTLED
jgi:LuxR family maltose regulon positive regulatory protein